MPAHNSIRDTLLSTYDRVAWQSQLVVLFPIDSVLLLRRPEKLDAVHKDVKKILQLGTITLPEDGATIALLEITTTDQVRLARNRVSLRNFVARFIDQAQTSAVLAVFIQENTPDWRLTYAARKTIFDDEFKPRDIETPPKRYTFLLGPHEPCRTPEARLAEIKKHRDALTLKKVEQAFSVEKLSREFFDKYNAHYEAFLAALLSPERATDTRERFAIPTESNPEAQEAADKPIRDYVKKLLGRLIFLQFLQKKGWLHKADTSSLDTEGFDWSQGDRDFLRSYHALAVANGHSETFHSAYLAPLFFQALNTERPHSQFSIFDSQFTIPYLNGGLFDPDPEPLQSLNLPIPLFTNLFDFFAEYNFTIDEHDPEDHEVGIDPEMLGHIFENLLEDNKDKGAYYTPKVIVAYMCRQSLLHYLQRHLGHHEALTQLVEHHHPGDLLAKDNWCAANAQKIATLLDTVKICDPAIGSGAFPIGMLNEIVLIRTLLNAELNDPAERAKLKRQVIQKSIYGVDVDSGAIDIARLRFWLALVVDETKPSPLPNLDYKIMQGNSLIESFHGVDLSKLHSCLEERTYQITGIFGNEGELNLQDQTQQEFAEKATATSGRLMEARRAYFAARKPERKTQLREEIDAHVLQHIETCLDFDLEKTEALIDQHHKVVNGTQPKPKGWNARTAPKKLAALEKQRAEIETAHRELRKITTQAERPFFLWHLLFQDVFQDGGFDIVIANPPYVRQELIKDQKPLLQAEGYRVFTGTADLLCYFYESAAKTLLKPGGTLTFITSNKFYRAGYGEKLRTFLTNTLTLHTLIDFRDAPVFNGVIAYASILIGTKEKAPDGHETKALPWDLTQPAAALPAEIQRAFPLRQDSLTPDGWRLVSPAVTALLDKLRQKGTPLGEYVEGRFYYGIKTGFNEAFVIDGAKRAELIAADPKSEQIIKPFLRGRDVKRWKATHADLWLIKIESSSNATHAWSNEEDAEAIFKKGYPAIYKWFDRHRERLINRDDQGQYFWELRSCAYWQEFEQPKIVIPAIESRASYATDQESSYSNDKTSICLTKNPGFLAAILNSNPSQFRIEQVSASRQNGYFEYKPMYVEPTPIPPARDCDKAKLATLAEKCAAAAAADDQPILEAHEHEINQIVYRLFDLTPEEIALIESSLES